MTLIGAIGSLGPSPEQLPSLSSALSTIADNPECVLVSASTPYPAACIDGRPHSGRADGDLPQTAGATLTTWAVDLLLTKLFASDDLTGWLAHICDALKQSGLPVSGHRAETHGAGTSGCGAADGLGAILTMLAQNRNGIADLLTRWGIDPELVTGAVRSEAAGLSTALPSGAKIIEIIDSAAGAQIPTLEGPHAEVAIVANTRLGQVVGRGALAHELDSVPGTAQAFCVDVWALPAIGDFFARSSSEISQYDRDQITAVAAAFNAAALLVLCGPSTPVVVL